METPRVTLLAVSLKMYLPYEETIVWLKAVRNAWRSLPAHTAARIRLVILPTYVALPDARQILEGTGIEWGAQDLSWEDMGPLTGEVSPLDLVQVGCTFAETGHSERRTLLGETDHTVLRKNEAAMRNGLTPILCVGDARAGSSEAALEECKRQLTHTLPYREQARGSLVIAYEPIWAIGAAEPAPPGHITSVCQGLREWMPVAFPFLTVQIIYGGSAGPGLITRIGDNCDGLFLGRYAHDVTALKNIIREAAKLG